MKRLLLMAMTAVLLSSCSPKLFPRETYSSVIDFRPFTEKGFYLSANPYYGECTNLGLVSIKIIAATKGDKVTMTDAPQYGEMSPGASNTTVVQQVLYEEDIDTDELLDVLVKEAKELGADGISELKMTVGGEWYPVNKSISQMRKTYNLSGTAIKIAR